MLLFRKVHFIYDRFSFCFDSIFPKLMNLSSYEIKCILFEKMNLKALILRYFPYCFWAQNRFKIHFFDPTSFRLWFTSFYPNRFIQGAFSIEIDWSFQIFLPPHATIHMREPKMPSLHPVYVKTADFYHFWRFSLNYTVHRCWLKGQHMLNSRKIWDFSSISHFESCSYDKYSMN